MISTIITTLQIEAVGNKKLLNKSKTAISITEKWGKGLDSFFSFRGALVLILYSICITLKLGACFESEALLEELQRGDCGGLGHPRFTSPLSPNQFFKQEQCSLREKREWNEIGRTGQGVMSS